MMVLQSQITSFTLFLLILFNQNTAQKELEVALKYGKKIIPLASRNGAGLDELMHPEIQKLNWFYFDSERKFQHGFTELLKTTSTDPGYLEANTKWLQKAVEWDSHDKNRDFLLGETETILAEAWINDAIEKQKSPPPSELNVEYITASVEGVAFVKQRKKRNGYLIRALSIVMTIAAIIAVYSFFQADEAKDKALSAQQQERLNERKRLKKLKFKPLRKKRKQLKRRRRLKRKEKRPKRHKK